MSVLIGVVSLAVFEILYQRYGMSSQKWAVRLMSVGGLSFSMFLLPPIDEITPQMLAVLCMGLAYIGLVDWQVQRIPNTMLVWLIINRCVLWIQTPQHVWESLLCASVWLVGLGVVHKLTASGIGAGDVKCISVLGMYTGFFYSTFMLLCACLLVFIVGVIRWVMKRDKLNVALPMGPFLCVACIAVVLYSAYTIEVMLG